MELVLWLVAGAVLGWLAIAYMKINEDRGTMVSMIIGAAGGAAGGKMLAPMFGAAAAVPGEFSMAALVVVLGSAAACLMLGNFIHNRYGV
jgi:uncharacterized membrane protein YeaQ/YmgE (transglycosylase-associated protein family)